MMSYRLLVIMIFSLFITSCSLFKEPEVVTVYKTKEVYMPIPCDVEVSCDFRGEGFEPTVKLLKCVEEQKRALDYCKQVGE